MDGVTSRANDARIANGIGGRFYGVLTAIVTDIKDPDDQGRVKIALSAAPDSGEPGHEAWARLSTLMAGDNRGTWFVPDVGDEVLVAFLRGDPAHPFVLGGLWNGSATPPESMGGGGNNDKKVIRSRNGVKITLDDQDGQERFLVETPAGQKVELRDGPGSVKISDSNGNSITLEPSGITVEASAKVSVKASEVFVSAGAVQMDAAIATFAGVIKCDTLIATTVVGSNYTPGAGNIW